MKDARKPPPQIQRPAQPAELMLSQTPTEHRRAREAQARELGLPVPDDAAEGQQRAQAGVEGVRDHEELGAGEVGRHVGVE